MSLFELIVVQPIFNALMVLYGLIPGGEFGVSVILFTIIVRCLMWPLVKKQLHQVKAMRKMQPELAKIKKKAKGDRQVEGMMMMELYKRHNVNPFRSIGLLLIQLPIFIGLYQVIRIFTDRRDELAHFTYAILEKWEPVANLIAHPDTFNQHLFGVIDLTKHAVNMGANEYSPFLIVLAVGAGFLQYVSTKQTSPQQETKEKKGLRQIMAEAADGKQADQADINNAVMGKMLKIMPLFMTFIMLTLPGAIALYYAVSTAVAVLQQHILLRRDEEELEEMADKQEAKDKKKRAKARAEKAQAAEVVADVPAKKPAVKSAKTTTKKTSTKSKKTTAHATVRVVAKPTKKGRK